MNWSNPYTSTFPVCALRFWCYSSEENPHGKSNYWIIPYAGFWIPSHTHVNWLRPICLHVLILLLHSIDHKHCLWGVKNKHEALVLTAFSVFRRCCFTERGSGRFWRKAGTRARVLGVGDRPATPAPAQLWGFDGRSLQTARRGRVVRSAPFFFVFRFTPPGLSRKPRIFSPPHTQSRQLADREEILQKKCTAPLNCGPQSNKSVLNDAEVIYDHFHIVSLCIEIYWLTHQFDPQFCYLYATYEYECDIWNFLWYRFHIDHFYLLVKQLTLGGVSFERAVCVGCVRFLCLCRRAQLAADMMSRRKLSQRVWLCDVGDGRPLSHVQIQLFHADP